MDFKKNKFMGSNNRSLKLNAALNALKQLLAIVFPLITVPYVSRVLGHVNYGKINFSASIISYFSLFAAFGISNYAIREGARKRQNKEEFNCFANEVFSINLITTIISYIGLALVVFFASSLHNYALLLFVQSIGILFTTLGADWINSIYEDFAYITLRYLIVQIVSLICMFTFVKSNDDYVVYAAITTLAKAGANLFNIFYIKRYAKLRFILRKSMWKHIVPMLILLGNSFAITIYVNSDTTILGFIKGEADVGIYSLATKIYVMVKQMLNALVVVSVPRLSALLGQGKKKEYVALLKKIFNSLLSVLLPALIGLYMISDETIFLIGGSEYAASASPLRILSISLCFAVLGCFFSNCILLPFRKDKQFLKATLAGCITNIGLNFIVIPLWTYNGAALTTLLAEFIVMTMCIVQSKEDARVKLDKRSTLSTVLGCLIIIAICYFDRKIISNMVLRLVISVLLSVASYAIVCIVAGNKAVLDLLKRKHK